MGLLAACTIPSNPVIPAPPDLTPYLCSRANRNPEFPGGPDTLLAYINQHKRYPAMAAQARVIGQVYVSFTIDTAGSVREVNVARGLGYGFDEEAVRLISNMPNWIPGKQYDRYTSFRYNLPITFSQRK